MFAQTNIKQFPHTNLMPVLTSLFAEVSELDGLSKRANCIVAQIYHFLGTVVESQWQPREVFD